MKILVCNDDGIHSIGLWALAKELQDLGTVTIVAPDRDQSGVGTSVTLRQPLRLSEIKSPLERVNAYSVEGTPADSVILALRHSMIDGVDLIVSGINEGPNLGNDVFISGTVGAALQGYFYGIPAIAFSIGAFENLRFDVAAKLARLMANEISNKNLTKKLLLNVNIPNLPQEKIEGIEITSLDRREYTDSIKQGHDGKRQYYWITRGESKWHETPKTDVWALRQNRVSITPLHNNHDGSSHALLASIATNLSRQLPNGNFSD